MPQLIITVNIPLVDIDGKDHRAVKKIDLWVYLTSTQQTALAGFAARVEQVVQTRYGPTAVVEDMRYEAEP